MLQIHIEMDLQKPISRGRTLNIIGIKIWVPLIYEKLPRLCFRCGKIIHGRDFYNEEATTPNNFNGQYRPWFRVEMGWRAVKINSKFGHLSSSSTKKSECSNRDKSKKEPLKGAEKVEVSDNGRKSKNFIIKMGEVKENLPRQTLVEPYMEILEISRV